MSIADSFDAMTSKRNYRDAIDLENAIYEITINKGKQFDPKIADIFLSMLKREGMAILRSNQSDRVHA
jgi:HD-GYP domain-containing protein (c-di-GMP phosphodiesterase class II)